jgi:hypothetical protein
VISAVKSSPVREVGWLIEQPEFAAIGKPHHFMSSGLERINLALRHGLLVYVDANGALIKAGQVRDFVDGLLVIDVASPVGGQLGGACRNQATGLP